jgi:hypothetical protein
MDALDMDSSVMIYIPSFIKSVQAYKFNRGGTQTR